ncbi:MAG: ADP-ribosylglycohydrolase family protein, partial [Dysgonamonadaceae bacterium]|nr:ADP-ribosylglycohydrolase family protein [Dysgonamonadaceae bacterium]
SEEAPSTLYIAKSIIINTLLQEQYHFEDILRNAIYVGGDSDTIASITCALATAVYPILPFRQSRQYPEDVLATALENYPEFFQTIISGHNPNLLIQ